MAEAAAILQICPNDHPPFRDLCGAYESAAECLGAAATTVFLEPPRAEPLENAVYLDAADVTRTRRLARSLAHVGTGGPGIALAVCHRYRSLRVLLASGLPVRRIVTVAHEVGLLRRRQRRWYRAVVARRARFAGVSPPVQADLARVVPDALCLPNALDLPAFDAALLPRAAARTRLGLEGATFAVGVAGRLIPGKRPELALRAWRRFDGADDARLLFFGDGPLEQSLRELACGSTARLLGFRPDLRSVLPALDALLLVSEPREAVGMVVLEAMAARVPVIIGPAPGPAFVTGGEAYHYAEATDLAIARALAEARLGVADGSAALGADRARRRVESEFTAEALARRLAPLLPAR
jgi:hypothetical protein